MSEALLTLDSLETLLRARDLDPGAFATVELASWLRSNAGLVTAEGSMAVARAIQRRAQAGGAPASPQPKEPMCASPCPPSPSS